MMNPEKTASIQEALIKRYIDLKLKKDEIEKEQKIIKEDLIKIYGGEFKEFGLKCSYIESKGSIDYKKLAIVNNWEDSYLDSFRKDRNGSFTITIDNKYFLECR